MTQSELQPPTPNRLIRDIDPTFGEPIFNVSKTERKPEIQPNGMLYDFWWKAVTGT
jgi:hypothetical protein